MPKLHILYDFKDGPWGGGNQFLKALRAALIKADAYSEDPFAVEAILFNSHHFNDNHSGLTTLCDVRARNPKVAFMHRVDGPIKLVRGGYLPTDKLIFKANEFLADGTIFQTDWSYRNSLKLGMKPKGPVTQILNAADPDIFNSRNKKPRGPKLRLIATSWAANKRKGFDVYAYLDKALDFDRYDMTFVGNSPVAFANIKCAPPVSSRELAEILSRHDIFITASVNDPCSNSLIEGLSCGLPALVRNSGGHPEILGANGFAFEGTADVLQKLGFLEKSYDRIAANIRIPSMEETAQRYIEFAEECVAKRHVSSKKENIEEKTQSLAHMIDRYHVQEIIYGGVLRRLGFVR